MRIKIMNKIQDSHHCGNKTPIVGNAIFVVVMKLYRSKNLFG